MSFITKTDVNTFNNYCPGVFNEIVAKCKDIRCCNEVCTKSKCAFCNNCDDIISQIKKPATIYSNPSIKSFNKCVADNPDIRKKYNCQSALYDCCSKNSQDKYLLCPAYAQNYCVMSILPVENPNEPTPEPTEVPYSPTPTDIPYSPEPTQWPYSPTPNDIPYSPEPTQWPYSPTPTEVPYSTDTTEVPYSTDTTEVPYSPETNEVPYSPETNEVPTPTEWSYSPEPTDVPYSPETNEVPTPTEWSYSPEPTDVPYSPTSTELPYSPTPTEVPTYSPNQVPNSPNQVSKVPQQHQNMLPKIIFFLGVVAILIFLFSNKKNISRPRK